MKSTTRRIAVVRGANPDEVASCAPKRRVVVTARRDVVISGSKDIEEIREEIARRRKERRRQITEIEKDS